MKGGGFCTWCLSSGSAAAAAAANPGGEGGSAPGVGSLSLGRLIIAGNIARLRTPVTAPGVGSLCSIVLTEIYSINATDRDFSHGFSRLYNVEEQIPCEFPKENMWSPRTLPLAQAILYH